MITKEKMQLIMTTNQMCNSDHAPLAPAKAVFYFQVTQKELLLFCGLQLPLLTWPMYFVLFLKECECVILVFLSSGFSYAQFAVDASARNSISCNTSVYDFGFLSCMLLNSPHVLYRTLYELRNEKSNRTGTGAIKSQIPLLKPKREINKYYK